MPKKMLFAAAGAALLLTASFAWHAEATTLGPLQTAVKDYSPIEPAAAKSIFLGMISSSNSRGERML